MKKYILTLVLLLSTPIVSSFANKNIVDEGIQVNQIVVSGISIKVSENSNYVYLFVNKGGHTLLATKFNK
jgi:hypothetical protein